MNITILGAGAFGTALGSVLEENHHHVTFFDPIKFPETSLEKTLEGAHYVILAAPSESTPKILEQLPKETHLICASKGFLSEKPFLKFQKFDIISGATFAKDLVDHVHSTLTGTSDTVKKLFQTDWLDVELSKDYRGILLCGAFKNIYAIGSGLKTLSPIKNRTEFLEYIEEAARELEEILKVNHADPETVSLSCGIGDLILTCSSEKSRNYQLGKSIAEKTTIDQSTTTEGLSAIKTIKTDLDFIMPKDTFILSNIIETVTIKGLL